MITKQALLRSLPGLAVGLGLLHAGVARASWGGFVSMGTATTIGDASCTLLSNGKAICGARSLQHTLAVDEFSSGTWSGWKNITGTVGSSPSCTDDGDGNVICAAQGATSALVTTKFNGTTWSALITVGAAHFSPQLRVLRNRQTGLRSPQPHRRTRSHGVQRNRLERVRQPQRESDLRSQLRG